MLTGLAESLLTQKFVGTFEAQDFRECYTEALDKEADVLAHVDIGVLTYTI